MRHVCPLTGKLLPGVAPPTGNLLTPPFQPMNWESAPTCTPKPDAPAGWMVQGCLIVPLGNKRTLTRLRRIPYKSGKRVSFRAVVEFSVGGPLNMKLYKKLKLPAGWQRCPRQQWKNDNNFPIRLRTYNPSSISADEMEMLQAQFALMVK